MLYVPYELTWNMMKIAVLCMLCELWMQYHNNEHVRNGDVCLKTCIIYVLINIVKFTPWVDKLGINLTHVKDGVHDGVN